jgi:hypothetical protein
MAVTGSNRRSHVRHECKRAGPFLRSKCAFLAQNWIR